MSVTCPKCKAEVGSEYGICGDYDDMCECDSIYHCKCGVHMIINCPAHTGSPKDYIELDEEGEVLK